MNKSTEGPIRILIVDDHPIVREGIAGLINKEPDMVICGEAEDAAPALKQIARLHPHFVIIDISLRTSDGIELVKTIQDSYRQLPILVLSMYEESYYAERALKAGAMGYIMKREARKELIRAIHTIVQGQLYFSDKCTHMLLTKMRCSRSDSGGTNNLIDLLSNREWQVFRLMGQGDGTKQIAHKLCLSASTIETYYSHMKRKLALENNNQLRHYAIDAMRQFPE